jgi:hypothetical protein
MTPKEKAVELVLKFEDYSDSADERGFAKKCALVAVDEIIKSQPSFPMAWNLGIEINGLVDNANFPSNYWQEVKQEIEKFK